MNERELRQLIREEILNEGLPQTPNEIIEFAEEMKDAFKNELKEISEAESETVSIDKKKVSEAMKIVLELQKQKTKKKKSIHQKYQGKRKRMIESAKKGIKKLTGMTAEEILEEMGPDVVKLDKMMDEMFMQWCENTAKKELE